MRLEAYNFPSRRGRRTSNYNYNYILGCSIFLAMREGSGRWGGWSKMIGKLESPEDIIGKTGISHWKCMGLLKRMFLSGFPIVFLRYGAC